MHAPTPNQRSESAFTDFKLPLLRDAAVAEANRCLFCHDAPCIKACPTAIDIPQFIRKIATDNVRGSAKTIFESNILGMSCARVCPVEVLCVGACVYNDLEQPPIAIGQLQRYATDIAYSEGWRFFEAGAPTGRRVALIGAGPASLAAAHELRRLGHACTIFEKRSVVGGLNATGVAPYKMRADRAATEVEWVLSIGGIDVRAGVEIGRDIALADLERDFDAIFVGVGLGADSKLGVPGEGLAGVHGAVAWIEAMKLGKVDVVSIRRAAVIGGGNTAIDVVREVLGLGIPHVEMIYRGTRDRMSGYGHEWEAALTEGAHAEWNAVATAIEGAVRAERVRCVRVDADKRPIAGSDFAVDADLVLLAIGQSKLGAMLAELGGITLDAGRIRTDADGFTGRAKWYAGGDCTNGGKEVVNAAAEGKRAAHAIDAAITGKGRAHA
ncbi:MAG: FAD-dependent oxidoreductase [Planctomycetaceae bacterium]|nr:FAD-dependent oxidoreductase [Planctomycetaceae bacterium]